MGCEQLLRQLDPDPDFLVAAICQQVDDAMLERIAEADHARDMAEHLTQLRAIRASGHVPEPLEWHPKQVLALIRWSQPVRESAQLSGSALDNEWIREHIMRAFACACLLRASARIMPMRDYSESDNETLAPLLESLLLFDPPLQETALRFVAWCAQHVLDGETQKPFYLFALLLLTLRTHAKVSATELKELVACAYASEEAARKAMLNFPENEAQWALGLTFFQQSHAIWEKLGKELFILAVDIEDAEARDEIQILTHRLEIKASS